MNGSKDPLLLSQQRVSGLRASQAPRARRGARGGGGTGVAEAEAVEIEDPRARDRGREMGLDALGLRARRGCLWAQVPAPPAVAG